MSELEQLREENTRLKNIIRHAVAEKTGVFFVCGEGGETGPDGLPKLILICPAYGLDGFAVYTKTTDYSAPSY